MSAKSFIAGLAAASAVSASTVIDLGRATCLTNPPTAEDIANTEHLIEVEERSRRAGNDTIRAPITVETYIHIIASDETVPGGWISDEQVQDQIDVMNDDFAPHEISFDLVDVTRTVNPSWASDSGELTYKAELRQGGYDALNLYVLRSLGGALGYCYYPVDHPSEGTTEFVRDGCSVIADSVPGGSAEGFNLGKTATHEIGHWLALYHTFQGSGCSEPGDFVDDTPTQLSASSGCPVGRDSCPDLPGLDPITNYMDYSTDDCFEEFTEGQSVRMHSAWEEFRA